jgi:hypothetical protein
VGADTAVEADGADDDEDGADEIDWSAVDFDALEAAALNG